MAGRIVRMLIWPSIALAIAGTALHVAWMHGLGHPSLDTLIDEWVYNAVVVLAGIACLLRAAAVRAGRGPWIAFGLGLLAWAGGDIYWSAQFENSPQIPAPSWADAGFLSTLLFFYIGIALLLRERIGSWTFARVLDALITGLASATIAAATLGPALLGLTEGDPGTVFTNLAYPIADLLLLGLVIGGLAVIQWRGSRPLLLVAGGLLTWAIADSWYFYLDATGSYDGGTVDTLWLLGAIAVSAAAATSTTRPEPLRRRYRASILPLALAALVAVAALIWDHFTPRSDAVVWLAGATLVAVSVRLAWSFRENASLMSALQREAVTDALTGLGNRRELFADLEDLLERRTGPHILALFDLDGFKTYNDTFGHPAGDALLRRLGLRLAERASPHGAAYRLGGDEFCVIARATPATSEMLLSRARAALAETGEGFDISASAGAVVIPEEAGTASEALRIADRRMYADKNSRVGRNEHVARGLLLQILRDREPTLSDHQLGVAELARRLAREIRLDAEQIDVISRAAELHDVGKIAIPDEILTKRGPLTPGERELIETHTLVGERILTAAPAMAPVAALVRHSHERWDGDGYPDGLAREEIPLGSRLIFICDSFEAMTTGRPYRAPSSVEDAIAELRRCAGSQFDPRLVEFFCSAIAPQIAVERAAREALPADPS